MHIEQAYNEEMCRLLWSLYILVCVIQCLCQLHTHTHADSHNTTHTQIYLMSLMVTQTLTHWHTCPTREVSGLLLSYTCALSSNTFCFILLPESSLSVQKTQDQKKKRKPWGPVQTVSLFLHFQNDMQGNWLFSILKRSQRESLPGPD